MHQKVMRFAKRIGTLENMLFIRKTSEPQKPFCTVEVRGGKVAQARIQNNEDPPPEAQEFISLWEQLKVSAPERVAA